MIDWHSPMKETYKFYKVDPITWQNEQLLDVITKCTIDRDSEKSTRGSASMECAQLIDECYIRVYLVASQNGRSEEIPLGTFLVQPPGYKFDGKVKSYSMDCYTPLIELKENQPPIGYTVLKGENILDRAYDICSDNMRAPIIRTTKEDKMSSNFTAEPNEYWADYAQALLSNASYYLDVDEMGRGIFCPNQNLTDMSPIYTYNDDNSSILYPDLDLSKDTYNIPNVVEVVWSTATGVMTSRVVNDDKNSPVSTVNRGREVIYRKTDPLLPNIVDRYVLNQYAVNLLKDLSSIECMVTYKHGYCPVRVGDCVLLNYKRAGLENVRAKVISQSIECTTGCPVSETAVYTTNLWG